VANAVTKLRPSDGAILGTFSTGGNRPTLLASDGANIWVTNEFSNQVVKFANDGTLIGAYQTGSAPIGVAFDGNSIWGEQRRRHGNEVTGQ
jgi:DNA-binding beta-propeller fold protein YncE